MIAPDMATMLGYIFTDAKIDQKILQSCLNAAVSRSFNSISVDSDTSTSDSSYFAPLERQTIVYLGQHGIQS